MKKICNKCGIERPLEKFSPRKPRKYCWHDGRENVCLYCRAEHDLINRKWPQKYRHFDKRELFKVTEKEKYYFTDSGSLYIQLKIGFRRVKSDFITIGNKQIPIKRLKEKYLATA